MVDVKDLEKKPIKNGLSNDSEDSGTTSEQEPCLPTEVKLKNANDISGPIDSKHLDTETIKQNKKRHNVNKKHNVSKWTSLKTYLYTMVTGLKQKTGLSNIGLAIAVIVIVMLIFFFVVLLVLGTIWPTIPHEMKFPICRISACLRSSAEILPKMNTSVKACDDFEGFACGGWIQSQPEPPVDRREWSLKRSLEYKTRDRLRQLILTQPHPTRVSSFAGKTKYFYESCMGLDTVDTVKSNDLVNQISSLGGWSVLRDFQVHSFDFKNTFMELHSNFGVALFIKVDVVPDPASGQDNIVQILPPDLGLPDKSYYYRPQSSLPVVTYKRFLKDVAQLLGATSSDAGTFSEDMFFFEKRLAEIMPDKRDLHPLQTAHKVSVGDLKNIAPSVPLHDVLLSKYPEGNIEDSTKILVPYPEYLRNISNIISTTDRSALNNYMMWKLTEKFLPYLSEQFRDTLALYRRDLFGEKEPLQRWEFCIKTLQEFMGFGLAVLFQNKADNFENDVKTVNDIFQDIMRQTKRAVKEASWLSEELQEHIKQKLMSVKLEVGYLPGSNLLSDAFLEETYRKMFVINRDFFKTVKNGINFLKLQQQLRLIKFDEMYRWIDTASNFDMEVHYIAAANRVVVPQAILQEPFFHPGYPSSVLFGNLGTKIGAAIIDSISLWSVLYASDGILVDIQHPAVTQSENVFSYQLHCLRRWWGKEGFASSLASNRTAQSALTQLSGVAVAFKALEDQLKHLPHIHQPALENYEDGHLFFISYAQSVCSVKSPQQRDVDRTMDTHLDEKALLSVVLSQMKDFARLFSCSSTNTLYAALPCENVL